MTKAQIPDDQLIHQLQSGGTLEEQALSFLYKNNRNLIFNFIQKNKGTKEEAKDVFQEAVIQLYENIKNEKFKGQSAISSYLYSIARFIWLNRLKRQQTEQRILDTQYFDKTAEPFLNQFLGEEQKGLVMNLFEKLGTGCKNLLVYTIYYNYSMEEVVKQLNFTNEQVARNQKYKCLKRLKTMIKEQPALLNFLKP